MCSPRNLRDLLLAAPAGTRTTMGLDPGFRTGVKVAVVDATGKAVATEVIYPHQPQQTEKSLAVLAALVARFSVELIAIGNGTASRETDALAAELISQYPGEQADQDRGLGGGRLGVLRFGVRLGRTARHGRLAARRGLDRAAPAGPARRAGEDRPQVDRRRPVPARRLRDAARALARRGRRGRGERGRCRRQHRLGAAAVAGLGHRRVAGGEHRGPPRRRTARSAPARPAQGCRAWAPRLSSSARASCASAAATTRSTPPRVHPEAYPVVRRIVEHAARGVHEVIGNTARLRALQARRTSSTTSSVCPTVTDIIAELEKPGRDPRPEFKTATSPRASRRSPT